MHFFKYFKEVFKKIDQKIAEIAKSEEEKTGLIASLVTANETLCEEMVKLKKSEEFKHEIADLKDIILRRNKEIENLKSFKNLI